MKILMIGGTKFVGRMISEEALRRGHEITLFHRGYTHPDLFPKAKRIIGDREKDLSLLAHGQWDALIDTCGYTPKAVRLSANFLKGRVDHYTFISTVSVYPDWWLRDLITEEFPTWQVTPTPSDVVTNVNYGPLKAAAERVVLEEFPLNSLIIRPGLIVGPCDPTDRFTYWPVRVSRGGEILAPGKPNQKVQFIDVRDLANFILDLAERKAYGTFNATGPQSKSITLSDVLNTCAEVTKESPTFTWVDETFLESEGVGAYTELPLWIPESRDSIQCQKAFKEGLSIRPLFDTIKATLEWHQTRPIKYELQAGLSPEREVELLARWKQVRRN